ncbi:unnamed protein product [Cuscuta europaea]|uniref:NUC153 domain-containing protein n=1 Tax=Cuscuta europaea TaxID=41803 RepID=A0A9P0YK04_CUSEU|nr:unnamed protein product [Cuscuta europaea]
MAYQGGNLKSTSINGVKMYTVAGQNRSLASWIPPKKLKALRKDPNYLQRLDIIQDLRFETATTRIKVTPDGEYLIASGIYPPQIKVYELRELSLKFERHLISEIVNFEVLSDDYSKIAFLCADRSVCLHAKYGSHYSIRIPRMGRDIAYDCWSCDLMCAASSPELYRINLEQGRFLTSLSTQSPALNVVSRSKIHGLIACGGEDGAVECFDLRARSSVGRINAIAAAGDLDQEVTALEFDGDGGYLMAAGSSGGKVMIFDLRSSHPMQVKDHKYGSPIHNIKWHKTLNTERSKLITADHHVVRVWDPDTGEGMTSIEPTGGRINDLCVFSGTGLILVALDSSQIPSYFIPALGPAPKWCSYLENLTEEMEEGAQTTIYDDFKFLTKEDLDKLNLTHLIGTNLLRAYMHGYFINYRLYTKAKSLADPFMYDDYLEQQKKKKLEKQLESRITIKRKLPKVNKAFASKLLDNEEAEKVEGDGVDAKKASKKKKGPTSSEILEDQRFSAMFENKDFEIDERSQEYRALHPVASAKKASLLEEHFNPVMDGEDQSDSESGAPSTSEDDEHDKRKKARVPRLYAVKDDRHADAFWNNRSLAEEDALPLEERVAALSNKNNNSQQDFDIKVGPGGSREMSFTAKRSSKYKKDDDDEDREEKPMKRRGIQSLKLKPDGPASGFRGRGRGGRSGAGRGRGQGKGRGRGRR